MTRDVFRSPASILGANAVQQYDDEAVVYAAHEHGYTFREGLGYLADDPECAGCREAATAKWKAAWSRRAAALVVEALLQPDSPSLPDDIGPHPEPTPDPEDGGVL